MKENMESDDDSRDYCFSDHLSDSKSWNQAAFVRAIRTIYAFNWLFRKRKMFGFGTKKRSQGSEVKLNGESTHNNTRITSEILMKSEHSLTSFLKKHFLIIFSEILLFYLFFHCLKDFLDRCWFDFSIFAFIYKIRLNAKRFLGEFFFFSFTFLNDFMFKFARNVFCFFSF